jgi:hypothetical protein
MVIFLVEPGFGAKASNWLLVAEGLDDSPGWSRFSPCLATDSQRSRFERAVGEMGPYNTPKLCWEQTREGRCVFEYSWGIGDDSVLEHASGVVAILQMDLFEVAPSIGIPLAA